MDKVKCKRHWWDKVLTALIFANETFAFRKSTRCSGTFYRRRRSPRLAAIDSIYVAAGQTERNEISEVERCGTLARARGLSALARNPPLFHPARPRERAFSLLVDCARRSRASAVRQSVSWRVINQSSSRTCETRSATLARSPRIHEGWEDGREIGKCTRGTGETYGHDLIGRSGRPMASYCRG